MILVETHFPANIYASFVRPVWNNMYFMYGNCVVLSSVPLPFRSLLTHKPNIHSNVIRISSIQTSHMCTNICAAQSNDTYVYVCHSTLRIYCTHKHTHSLTHGHEFRKLECVRLVHFFPLKPHFECGAAAAAATTIAIVRFKSNRSCCCWFSSFYSRILHQITPSILCNRNTYTTYAEKLRNSETTKTFGVCAVCLNIVIAFTMKSYEILRWIFFFVLAATRNQTKRQFFLFFLF